MNFSALPVGDFHYTDVRLLTVTAYLKTVIATVPHGTTELRKGRIPCDRANDLVYSRDDKLCSKSVQSKEPCKVLKSLTQHIMNHCFHPQLET